MESYSNGNANFVLIDKYNFNSAMEWANQRGYRIRMSEKDAVMQFIFDNDMDLVFVQTISREIQQSKMAIISKGLMKGLYIYDLDASNNLNNVYYYFNSNGITNIKPLTKYEANSLVYDLVISYNNKDLKEAQTLFEKLDKFFNIFFIDIASAGDDPLWPIRFREAMYYGHYFTPYFSENYLNSTGALAEFFEATWINVEFFKSQFFYFFIPLIKGNDFVGKNYISRIPGMSQDDIKYLLNHPEKTNELGAYDANELEKVLNTVYSVDLNTGYDFTIAFLKSLLINNKITQRSSIKDYEFLDYLLREVSHISFHKDNSEKFNKVTLYIPIPYDTDAYVIIILSSDGSCYRHDFTTEVIQAPEISSLSNPYQQIINHLNRKDGYN